MSSITIKVRNNNDLRRICIPRSSSFEYLRKLFNQLYNMENFVIKYLDDEEDFITVSSDEELEEAFRLTKEGSILRITLSRPGEDVSYATNKADLFSSSLGNSSLRQSASNSTPSQQPSASGGIVKDVVQLAENIAETSRQVSTEVTKKGEYIANQASQKAIELANNIVDSTIQLANSSATIGEDLRKRTFERSIELSEKTTQSLNHLSSSTATQVDEASARIRNIIMGLKV